MYNIIIIILWSLEYIFVEFDGFETKQKIGLLKNVLNSSRIRHPSKLAYFLVTVISTYRLISKRNTL